MSITLKPVWIYCNHNPDADVLSRCTDSDDWVIETQIFVLMNVGETTHVMCSRTILMLNVRFFIQNGGTLVLLESMHCWG